MEYITILNKKQRVKGLLSTIHANKEQFLANKRFDIENNVQISIFDLELIDKELNIYHQIEKLLIDLK